MRCLILIVSLCPLAVLAHPTPLEPRVLESARETLRNAGLKSDGESALGYLRERIATPKKLERIQRWIRELGADDFTVREEASAHLLLAGELARAPLEAVQNDTDAERARRAQRCLDALEEGQSDRVTIALLEVLGHEKPKGTVEALLAYTPQATDPIVFDPLVSSLERVGVQKHTVHPALIASLRDGHPLRRAVAVLAIGRSTGTKYHKALLERIEDTDAAVRFYAASTLVYGGERKGLETLIDLVGEGPMELAYRAENLLFRIARENSPHVGLVKDDPKQRQQSREAWRAWLAKAADSVDLKRLRRQPPPLGIRLVCGLSGGDGKGNGNVFEYGPDNKRLWEIHVEGNPVDVQRLENGHVLVAEYAGNRVTERDRKGTIVFEKKLGSSAVTAQPLPNGNIFIAGSSEILEVTRSGKTLYSYKVNGFNIYHAQKLDNNRVLYLGSNGKIVELDPRTKQIFRTIPAGDTSRWGSVEPLPGGNFLVARCGPGTVVELTPQGKEVWSASIETPTWAKRLPNGHVLVACAAQNALAEFDRNGKLVWSEKHNCSPCRFRQY